MQANAENKERASKMESNVCVMVLELSYSVETGKVKTEYTNYRDLAGDEEDVSFFKNLFEEKLKGSFKV